MIGLSFRYGDSGPLDPSKRYSDEFGIRNLVQGLQHFYKYAVL